MSNNKAKNKYGMTRKQEKESSKMFGKYVTKEKAFVLGIFTTLVCMMPALVGVRLWNQIPEIVETGLIGSSGMDDSMPRGVLVFGIPGLMAVLNIICHAQLYLNQKAQRLAPQASRIVGRWGFPILSSVFASGCAFSAAGEKLRATFTVPCLLAIILLLIGSHFFDCKRDSKISLNFEFLRLNPKVWDKTHRLAGVCWMFAGMLLMFFITYMGNVPVYSGIILIILLLIAVPYGKYQVKKQRL